ncbi:unnamed protein product [Protopolystoma xenopodis]|uniref:Uncharacterized protein n=1 Tax=Protopolystoma xenopodis TaxID=117903 RepID=A0A448WYE3_9PLAT|nr:unnamed protein product [Protopolystoma xenopodis]
MFPEGLIVGEIPTSIRQAVAPSKSRSRRLRQLNRSASNQHPQVGDAIGSNDLGISTPRPSTIKSQVGMSICSHYLLYPPFDDSSD